MCLQTKMLDMLKQTGRPEMVVGWYHSHPGFGKFSNNQSLCNNKYKAKDSYTSYITRSSFYFLRLFYLWIFLIYFHPIDIQKSFLKCYLGQIPDYAGCDLIS